MKKLILILFVILAIVSGGLITVNSAIPPKPVQVNIPTCPPEIAYMFDGDIFWALGGGAISNYYNRMTVDEFYREAKNAGSPADLKQCPPANGNMRNSLGMHLNIPMGFFDDEDNWFTQEEYDNR